MSNKRVSEDKRRLKKVYDETKSKYGPGVWYDEERGRYIRASFTDVKLKSNCRRISRRRLDKETIAREKSFYKKLFDYWWELF